MPQWSSRLMVVDDEQPVRAMLSMLFTEAGYEVETAADAIDAKRLFRSRAFDLVLSDVDMPGLTGHDLARWITENRPGVHVVLMSGLNLECANCPLADGCPYLRKPFRAADAIAIVETALRRRY